MTVERLDHLDLFKTLLVWGMVATHVIQLIGFGLARPFHLFADYANLITFSGFMLAFGMGLGLSAASGRTPPPGRSLIGPLRLLVALWLSSFGFVTLVDRLPLEAGLVLDIVLARRLFGWSEFLASFFVVALVVACLRPQLAALARRPLLLAIGSMLGLASTLVVLDTAIPFLSAVFGTTRHASFPVLAYLVWFLVGLGIGARGTGELAGLLAWTLVPALALSALYFAPVWSDAPLRGRFPPQVLFVLGPAAFLWLYLALSRALTARWHIPKVLLLPGRHVLLFLVLSNLAIFAARHLFAFPVRDGLAVAGATLALMGAIGLIAFALESWRGLRRRVPA